MQFIGAVILFVGLVLLFLAWRKGREEGTAVTEGPPPPKPARTLMASGFLGAIVGLALIAMANV